MNTRPNPYLIALSTIGILTLIGGILLSMSLRSTAIGIALVAVGAITLTAWLATSAVIWQRENASERQ